MARTIEFEGQQVDADELLKALDRADYEESLYKFVQGAWRYVDPSEFVPGWPLEAVCEHLEAVADGQIRRLIINIPPRCSKSTITSVCFPAWIWAQPWRTPTLGPAVPFLCGSYAEKLALRDSVKCRRLIESPWYQGLWGSRFQLTSDQNTKSRFENDQQGVRLITSVDGTVTGEGGNIIILDDPNNAKDVMSTATIEATIEWWDGAVSTRHNDPKTGVFIVIQQRLGEEDLTGYIQSKMRGNWCELILPMRFEPERKFVNSIGWEDPRTEPGELLWEARFGEDEVKELETTLGPWRAAGQLQQRPEPKGGGIIKRDWWKLWDDDKYPSMDYIIASLDTAYTTKSENDYSAMTFWGVFSGEMLSRAHRAAGGDFVRTYVQQPPRLMLMYAWKARLELHDLVQKVMTTCRQMRVEKLLIENKAAGHSVEQELRRIFSDEGSPFAVQLIDPKGSDKVARLYSVQHIFAEGLVYAPNMQWAEMVMSEVGTFPRGKHDDLVDTVSSALRHLRDIGALQRTQEAQAERQVATEYPGRTLAPLYGVP